MNNSKIRFLGICGLVVFLFGMIGGFFIGHGHFIMITHMIVGLGLIGLWFALYGSKNLSATPKAIKGREARFGFNVILYSVVFLGVLAAINFLGAKDKYNLRWDTTEQGVFSLSDQTQKVLKDLKAPLKIAVFNTQGMRGGAFDQVKLYGHYSEKVKVEIIDPNAKPHLVDTYGMKPGNMIYIGYGEEGKAKVESRVNEMTEESITNAIVKLTKGAAKKIYYLVGHGEPDLTDTSARGLKQFADAVGDENLTIEDINLAQRGSVPADAAGLVVVNPKSPLFPDEKKALLDYADAGGKLLLAVDPIYPVAATDIHEIAAHYGIKVGKDVVLDAVMRIFAGPSIAFQFMASSVEQHPITSVMSQRDKPIMNLAASVTVSENKEGANYTELFKSSPNGWAETDIEAIFTQDEPVVEIGETDLRGPVSMAVSYEKELPSSGEDKKFTRVVVIGDTDWMTNGLFQQSGAHRDLALNTLGWIIGESSNISIRPKKFKSSITRLPTETFYIVLGSGFFVPELILIFGLFIWWRRRIA
jgi:ABC-type uncharacterized transport system involved in gliding motility auxiliary subunit